MINCAPLFFAEMLGRLEIALAAEASSVLKTLKRSMAAEYSRELSVKVFSGQCRLIELGFRQGGPPGYGLRRQLIDRDRNPKGLLGRGERKSLQTDRVILVPGPELEVETVRQIYELFVAQRKIEREITAELNGRGVLGEDGRPWTRATIHQVLTNPKYIGANIYNRRSFKLKHRRVNNPTQMWIWRDGAFEPIISASVFEKARSIIESRHHHLSDQDLLEKLRELLRARGQLSGILIDETEDMPSSSCYSSRFGSLTRAYSLIGWTPDRDYGAGETRLIYEVEVLLLGRSQASRPRKESLEGSCGPEDQRERVFDVRGRRPGRVERRLVRGKAGNGRHLDHWFAF